LLYDSDDNDVFNNDADFDHNDEKDIDGVVDDDEDDDKEEDDEWDTLVKKCS